MYIFSFPISTSIDIVSPNEDLFPRVTICNTNPLQYFKFPGGTPLEDVVYRASKRNYIDNNIYNTTSVRPKIPKRYGVWVGAWVGGWVCGYGWVGMCLGGSVGRLYGWLVCWSVCFKWVR